ncbi:hypothetical protein FE257_000046 [Aspergillus nanangensis]|uniref:Galactose oxidase n=1 Tax=Aspergillus nanangensis TaxID=2582783 RepID=A0AAD4CYN9_ASPNN|nr:hypothetical protein FE257_000046 [Aspergillus nanangensis]
MRTFPHFIELAVTLSLLGVAFAAPNCTPGEWIDLASIPTPRQEHGTAAIDNTTIAVLGGILNDGDASFSTDLLQLYDIATDTWSAGAPAPYKVNHPNVAAVNDKLYLVGGLTEGPVTPGLSMNWVASKLCYVYDLATDTWSDLAPMPNGTERGSAIVGVRGEMIYVAGGMTVLQPEYQDAVDSVISFNTTSGAWQRLVSAAAEIPESRQHATGSVIGQSFYVVGGRRYGKTNTFDTVFELDLDDQEAGWKVSSGHMPTRRGGIAGGAVGSDFYVFGGEGNPDTSTGIFNQSEVFDTRSQTWLELKPMPVPRHGTQAAVLGDRVYIPGGGLQQDGKKVIGPDGAVTYHNPTTHFDAYCA